MIRILFLLIISFITLDARMIGGVAITVDGEPITTNELRRAQKSGLTREQAVDLLIQQKLEERAIKEAGIYVNDLDIDHAIETIAKQNGLSVKQFKEELKKRGMNYRAYRAKLANDIAKERLYNKLTAGKIKKPTDAEMKAFYQKHKDKFKTLGFIEAVQYSSQDPKALQMIVAAPLMRQNGVITQDIKLDPSRLTPDIVKLFDKTPEGKFTPIIKMPKGFVMFYITKKHKPQTVPYAKVKDQILNIMTKERQNNILVDYFEKKRAEAYIKVVRKP